VEVNDLSAAPIPAGSECYKGPGRQSEYQPPVIFIVSISIIKINDAAWPIDGPSRSQGAFGCGSGKGEYGRRIAVYTSEGLTLLAELALQGLDGVC
jgi:hypothetical protein